MGLSDFHTDHHTVMDSREVLSWDSSEWISQVPDYSVGARCPQPPREVATLQLLVASCHVLASPSLEGWPPRNMRNEAESGSRLRITADTFASGGFDVKITSDAAPSATWRTSTYHR